MNARRPTAVIAKDLHAALDGYVSAERQFLSAPKSADAAKALRNAERRFDRALRELRSAPHGGWADMRKRANTAKAASSAAKPASRALRRRAEQPDDLPSR